VVAGKEVAAGGWNCDGGSAHEANVPPPDYDSTIPLTSCAALWNSLSACAAL
jgi:hypothetical protein